MGRKCVVEKRRATPTRSAPSILLWEQGHVVGAIGVTMDWEMRTHTHTYTHEIVVVVSESTARAGGFSCVYKQNLVRMGESKKCAAHTHTRI